MPLRVGGIFLEVLIVVPPPLPEATSTTAFLLSAVAYVRLRVAGVEFRRRL
jgi:hypothetical protein